ncbi:MAG: class I tRNA ligase family protein [Methanobacteriota archaeon]
MLSLFNSMTGRVEPFEVPDGLVKMFTCGPTVYARVHLGHGKSYLAADLTRRMLVHEGFEVKHVVNYTDVSDETARKSAAKGLTELQLAERCEKAFERDMALLNIMPPELRPKVSEHIQEIISVAEMLVASGKAYVRGQAVYLRARKEDFGCLLRHPLEDSLVPHDADLAGAKESPLDFALWEPAPSGRLSWESPWGPGRPGWHVQDFAFVEKHLGPPIDIYTGGVDLVFPHHESEMLMARAVLDRPMSRFWMHNGHVTFEGQKLSKSKGVRVELSDLFRRFGGETVRFFLLQSHYREQTHFTDDAMAAAASRFGLIRDSWRALASSAEADGIHPCAKGPDKAGELWALLLGHLENDLRTDMALGELEKLASLTNQNLERWSLGERSFVRGIWRDASRLLGILGDYPEKLRSESPSDDCDC